MNEKKIDKWISILENPATYREMNERAMDIFRKEIVPEIYEAGENFPRDKESQEWQKVRRFSVPPSQWLLGVWSGATYTALIKGGVSERNIITEITDKRAVIKIGNSQYLNATLYLPSGAKELLLLEAKKILEKKLR